MDALSEVLAAVRLTSNAFLDARFSAPWSVAAQVGPEDCASLGAMPAQVVAYHYVVAGCLYIQLGKASPVPAAAGEMVLLPRNDPHVLSSSPGLTPALIDALIQPPDGDQPAVLRVGGGGEETHIVCGFLGSDLPGNPLLAALPPLLKLDVKDGAGGAWLGDSFQRAAQEFAVSGAGSTMVLCKLAELLFVEGVRRYVSGLPAEQTGWLAGLRDRIVGRALALMHARPTEPWTTEDIARQVGLSRSALAERFTALVGVPPMRYLGHWRLRLAALRLRESPRATAQIAYEVGYESEAAFTRAFKRAFGVTPGVWRRQ